ncbi:hypothetical protein AB7828_03545 [Tardiphaga sp. 215_C5_N2_1]|uniref:hypothetical protein n=1 Tax=Tardiphaga sp. 215_C5_N2_1 TaxID=3240774 RepID=UPI003F89E8C6
MIPGSSVHKQTLAALIEARIAFRKRWVLSNCYRKPKLHAHHIAWELEYDDEHNFAHIGAEFVEADWGRPKQKPLKVAKPAKSKARMPRPSLRASSKLLQAAE